MIQVKFITETYCYSMKESLNEALKDIEPENLIDIKFTQSEDENEIHYSALIIYKA